MLALKECLLAELKTAGGTSDLTASGEGYDEYLHSLMLTFWDVSGLGQITQSVTCTICSCITTRVESFSKLLLQFSEPHHEATQKNGRAHSIVSSNNILGKRTFLTMIAKLAAGGP
jgi:hypothetical protein